MRADPFPSQESVHRATISVVRVNDCEVAVKCSCGCGAWMLAEQQVALDEKRGRLLEVGVERSDFTLPLPDRLAQPLPVDRIGCIEVCGAALGKRRRHCVARPRQRAELERGANMVRLVEVVACKHAHRRCLRQRLADRRLARGRRADERDGTHTVYARKRTCHI
eukprot:scaffold39183_cov27-Tisochrysis_lutea.AAC.1